MKALARRGVLLFGFLIVPLVGLSQPSATLPGADDSPAVLGEDPGPPERLWTVRVGALATAADTQECVQRLRNLGYTSIVASGEGPVRSVWAGVFEYAVDAELCVDDLRRRAFRRVEIASIPATPGRNQAISRRLPVEAVFRLEAQHISETADPQFDPETDPVIQEGRAAEVLRSAEGDAALERLAEALPESDSRRAWIVLRLAHRAREEGQWDRALDLFQAVADGSMPVRRVDRINAMTRVGWILMYRTPDYRGAYRAYREIELFTGSETVRANALAEQAWIMFEILRNDRVGSWPEVRRFCARALARFEPGGSAERAKHRAVLRLIHLETFHFESRYDDVVRYAQAYLEQYGEDEARRREVGMARAWLGIAQMRLGQPDTARETFSDLAGMNLQPEENFAGEDMDVLAATYSFELGVREGNTDEMRFWAAYLQENHPDRAETATILRILPDRLARGE